MTMPIKPQSETNVGMYISPTLMNVLSEILSVNSTMAVNLLNTYNDKENDLPIYLADLARQGIKYNNLFIDRNNSDKLLEVVEHLIFDGFVQKSNEEVIRCECGKVDLLNSSVNSVISKLYYEKNGSFYCKSCGSLCTCDRDDVLLLNLPSDINDSMLIVPTFLKKDINHLSKTFKGSKFLISKKRNTGYELYYEGKQFNIDVDFLWKNYYKLFDAEHIIMIASNHQIHQMYLLNYLNKITDNKDICFIAHPYMNKVDNLNPMFEYEKTTDEIYKKLFILYNLKWKKKNCDWSKSVIDFLSSISTIRRNDLYRVILDCVNGQKNADLSSLNDLIESIFLKDINMQLNISESKRILRKK